MNTGDIDDRVQDINMEIMMLEADLRYLAESAEYDEPGIYYEQLREGSRIERRIADLIHELNCINDAREC